MKSKKEFDSTMLYPFFAEKEPGERFLSSVLSKKVVIEELVPLNLDPIMGRLSCGLGLLLNDGGKGIIEARLIRQADYAERLCAGNGAESL